MAEPSLSMDFAEIKAQVAYHLYGGTLDVTPNETLGVRDTPDAGTTFHDLDSGEKEVVKSVCRSGLRQFYSPPPIRKRKAHKWSFLDKTDNLVLNSPYTNGNTSTAIYDHTGHGSGETLIEVSTIAGTLSATNPATLTTATAHGYLVGEKLNLSGYSLTSGTISGNVLVKEVPSDTTFTVTNTAGVDINASGGVTDSSGDIYKVLPDWAASGMVEISGVSYGIASVTGKYITLDTGDNPGSDISLAAAFRLHQDDYTLPDDFGRLIDPLTFVEKENAWHSVGIVGEGRIRELRQRDYIGTNGSKPQVAAIRTVNNSIETGTRREIMFWPAVSGDYVLKMQYRVRPQDDLDDDDVPYGGTDHAETILYSCLAEAERRLDETQGVYNQRFIVSLASSIDLDSRMAGAHTLGYNSDRSDVGSAMGREYLFGSRIRHKNFSGTFTD